MGHFTDFAIRGEIFFATDKHSNASFEWRNLEDGVMILRNGRVLRVLTFEEFSKSDFREYPLLEYPNCLICPGFIDSHIHYAQTRLLASPAPGLLEWLHTHTYPEEQLFAKTDYCSEVADEFLNELVTNGTTSALAFPTVHKVSAQILFQQSHARNLRMVTGKVLMDQNAPEGLLDGTTLGVKETEGLIQEWHGTGRQSYAFILRFAGSSTRNQMIACRKLLEKYPDILFHTHLSETKAEISWVLQIYPEASDYVGIYESYGMVTERSSFAHCIHLSESECKRLADAGATAVLCPTSNTFIGSGLARPSYLAQHGVPMSMGTDIGGGTSFSMLQTMREMYAVAKLNGEHLDGIQLFYLATLAGAKTLKIDQHVGSFDVGKEADFVVMDDGGSNLMRRRLDRAKDIQERLFVYAIMGSVNNVRETWSMGSPVYQRDGARKLWSRQPVPR